MAILNRHLLLLAMLALVMAGTASAQSFERGQCTWHAQQKFNANLGNRSPKLNWSGNASAWFRNAANKGWEVHTSPKSVKVGAIIVWTDGDLGHVAYVRSYDLASGMFTISEMNWPTGAGESVKTMSIRNMDRAGKTKTYRFVGFIYPRHLGNYSVAPVP